MDLQIFPEVINNYFVQLILLSVVAFAWVILRYQFLDLMPVARVLSRKRAPLPAAKP